MTRTIKISRNISRIMAIICIFIIASNAKAASSFKNYKYDAKFAKEYNKYFYQYKHIYDYRIIKAQSIQESSLKPNAVSYVGASGLMQLMPGTYKGLIKQTKRNEAYNSIFDEDLNIELGVYYDYKLFKNWKSQRPLKDRFQLTFASYNAGLGHLINSQKLCIKSGQSGCNLYGNIISHLYKITGHHHKETEGYVHNIFKYYSIMIK